MLAKVADTDCYNTMELIIFVLKRKLKNKQTNQNTFYYPQAFQPQTSGYYLCTVTAVNIEKYEYNSIFQFDFEYTT